MKNETVEIRIDKNSEQEALETLHFLQSLDDQEKNNFMQFIKGAAFMRKLEAVPAAAEG